MTIVKSISTCLKKYFDFEGRATRSEYWWFWLATFILCYIPVVGWIIGIATIVPTIAAGVRRLHDTSHSGWWLLFPVVNIILLAKEGDASPNEYGAEPID